MILRVIAIAISLVACSTQIKQPLVQTDAPPSATISPTLALELETLYQRGHALDAMMKLSQYKGVDINGFKWLLEKAASGEPPFQYELSRQIQQSNAPGAGAKAIEWFAKAYVVRSLDFSECADKNRNPTNIVLLSFYAPLNEFVLKSPAAYAAALEKALEWERTRRIRPSSDWICQGFSLPIGDRAAARAVQTEEILAGIGRLKLKGAGQ